jgi:hypothetical protein
MRRLLVLSGSLLLAACATRPASVETPEAPPPTEHTAGGIVGLTADDLVHRFGTPALQVREGNSLKLQFRSDQCVLDAYLYPTGNAPYRVTYVDTRTPSLAKADQFSCMASLQAP